MHWTNSHNVINFLKLGRCVHTVSGSKNTDYILLYNTNVGEVCGEKSLSSPVFMSSKALETYKAALLHFCSLTLLHVTFRTQRRRKNDITSLHNYQAKRILKCLAPSVEAIVIGILTFDYSTKEPALGTNIGRTESNSGMILSNEGAAVGAG